MAPRAVSAKGHDRLRGEGWERAEKRENTTWDTALWLAGGKGPPRPLKPLEGPPRAARAARAAGVLQIERRKACPVRFGGTLGSPKKMT